MHTISADTTYTLLNTKEELRPTNVAHLKRIIEEDKFEHVYDDGFTHVYRPTKERQIGDNTFHYIFQEGSLINNTVIQLTGIHG